MAKKIGITGTIGSGKSFVGNMLRSKGYAVLDADQKIHDLYASCQNLRKDLLESFGGNCLTHDGVNRKFLADLIFSDAQAKKRLEEVVYPYLIKSVTEFLEVAENVCFVEAALFDRVPQILDTLDEMWVVSASDNVRLSRLMNRGLSKEDALRRMENQRHELDYLDGFCKPIHVIENDGDAVPIIPQV